MSHVSVEYWHYHSHDGVRGGMDEKCEFSPKKSVACLPEGKNLLFKNYTALMQKQSIIN